MRTSDKGDALTKTISIKIAATGDMASRSAWLLTACAAVLMLAGCGGGGGSSTPASISTPIVNPPTPAAPVSMSAVTPGGLTATLTESAATTAVGSSEFYTLTLANNTSQPITYTPITSLSLPTGSATSAVGGFLSITTSSEASVYPPSINGGTHGGGAIGPTATLAPGQSATGTVTTGNVFSAAGTYSATALFTSRPGDTSPAQTTSVGPLTVTVQ